MDEVGIHSRQKHALLEAYLRVWTQRVGANFAQDSPSLDIFDLFAGTGWCVERLYRKEEWPGTALIAAETLRDYPSRRNCGLYLNAWAKKELDRTEILSALRERVQATGFERSNRHAHYWSKRLEDALPLALEMHRDRAQYPSLWVLDPYAASILPWGALSQIAGRVGTYRDRQGRFRNRRPELFVNFMTSGLQENAHRPAIIAEVLGCTTAEWIEHRKRVELADGTFLDALTTFYADQLSEIYGRMPFIVPIPGKDGNPVSTIFLAVEHDAAWHSIRTQSLPYFESWQTLQYAPKKEWIRVRHRIDRALPPGVRQRDLTEYS